MAWITLINSKDLISSVDMGGSLSALRIGFDQLPTAKSNHTHREFFSQEWKMEDFHSPQSGMMLVRYEDTTYPKSISYMEDSPAKISALQEMEKAWEESEVDFSTKCVDWSKKYTQNSSSWKTSIWKRLCILLPLCTQNLSV